MLRIPPPCKKRLEPSPELDMVLTQRKRTLQRGSKTTIMAKRKARQKGKKMYVGAHDKEKVKRASEQTTQQHPAAI